MSRLRSTAGFVRGLGADILASALRKPDLLPMSGVTLDATDVALVRAALQHPETWGDEAPIFAYERAFSRWNGVEAAFAFDAGRAALSAAIEALQLGPADEVILPAYTCVVVPNAFRFARVPIVWADIELQTYGMDVESFIARIGPRTRAVVVQHLFGLVCRDYEALLAVARERGIYVIEDCAHATGALWRGQRVGVRADVAFYSSEQSKIFCTVRGGMVTTSSADLSRRLSEIAARAPRLPPARVRGLLRQALHLYDARTKGRFGRRFSGYRRADALTPSTTAVELAHQRPDLYAARLPAPLARLGEHQLARIDGYNAARREQAKKWEVWGRQKGYGLPLVLPDSVPVFLRYPLLATEAVKSDPSKVERELGVPVGVGFRGTEHPLSGVPEGCPNAAIAVARCINLPGLPSCRA